MAPGNVRSVRLWASYIIDWIMLIIFALIAYGFTFVHPHPHNFSLVDLTISYPLNNDTVPIWVVGVVAGVVPAAIILAVSLVVVPGRSFARGKTASQLLRLKLWEWHAGWLGLAMSLATAVMFTQGLKLFGKPRPNCLSRCKPDISRVQDHYTGHYAGDYNPGVGLAWALVDISICTETDEHTLFDGFQSWPSGHSSTAWSGLLYLTLYLCAKFAVVLPYLPSSRQTPNDGRTPSSVTGSSLSQSAYKKSDVLSPIRHRDEAAAPPVYMLLFIIVPIGGAVYICLSRYMDYAHHGFDILSGSILGAVCAYVSFRWYHLPIGRGSGWSWGPRSSDRAFAIGVGECGYVDEAEDYGERERENAFEPNRTSSAKGGLGGVDGQRSGEDEVELGLMNARGSIGAPPGETAYGHAR